MKIELDVWLTNGERYLHITATDPDCIHVDNHYGEKHNYKRWGSNVMSHECAQAEYARGAGWFCESPLDAAESEE